MLDNNIRQNLDFKVHITYAIAMTVQSIYPQNTAGYTITYFSNFDQAMPLLSLMISFFASSVGMSKWFLCGPFKILPKASPLNGLISLPFLCMVMLNMMFAVRVICIESAFFSSYRYRNSDINGEYNSEKLIEPILPPENRILAYITPCLISFSINLIRLLITKSSIKKYVRRYPQILISPCFTPFMFEGGGENDKGIRIWKLGTILNALFIGCLPQITLFIMDRYRNVTNWDFISVALRDEYIIETNDAMFKSRYGNTVFSIVLCLFFFVLIITFFLTDKIFQNNGIYCKCFTMICCPCPGNCSNLTNQLSLTQALETSPHLSQNDFGLKQLDSEELLTNVKNGTQIFIYTQDNKMWLQGEPVEDKQIKMDTVSLTRNRL